MSSCEKCLSETWGTEEYHDLLESRKDNPCTPEEQAGPDASKCPKCQRMTLHQIVGNCMNRDCPPKNLQIQIHSSVADPSGAAEGAIRFYRDMQREKDHA